MNIYLVPYTWIRHVVVALFVSGVAVVTWWLVLTLIAVVGPIAWGMGFYWAQGTETFMFLGGLAGAISFASVLAEGSLRRRALHWRLGYAAITGLLGLVLAVAWVGVNEFIAPYLSTSGQRELLADSSLASLRYRLASWGGAGAASGLGPLAARAAQRVVFRRFGQGEDAHTSHDPRSNAERSMVLFYHLGGGFAAGMCGAAVWQVLGYHLLQDLYLAGAMGAFVWGLVHGLLVWGVPDALYAGWIRVLSADRYGLRIPVDHVDGSPAERFVGHFPRGLDIFLPAEEGVAELHTSFTVDESRRYTVRGLSVQPTLVRRFLERVDLRYDPRRPAPLETSLSMGDRVEMGEGEHVTVVEFVLLPKEEQ